ncbi:hypothetical protein BVA22_03135 [Escherichia coli M4]|nr:hypothetical protein BVA22_03135 [Escherichia coli M4]
MKLKTVEINGKQYAEIDTAGLPVYVHDDGKEIGFDAPLATKKITELNGEAKNHRLAKEAAEEKLAKFAAIEDPKKAIEALEMLSKIDQKKLLDAGQVDQVKAEITKNFQQQLDEEKQRSQMLEKQLYDSMIGGSFAGSKYIADKIAIPADLLQARFGQAFKVEEGRIVAYDASGNKIYSRAKPGELEGFNIHSSAGVKRAPKVAATGYLVNGEKKEGDVLISIDTGSGSISAGQIVTFAGDPNQYVVAAATSNLITLAAPGLRQDLADDTAITVVGAFTANMAFDRNAFLLASRTPAMPEGGDNADDVMNVTDPISGITFQIALYRQYRQVRYEVGLAWGVSSVKPAHGCLILG